MKTTSRRSMLIGAAALAVAGVCPAQSALAAAGLPTNVVVPPPPVNGAPGWTEPFYVSAGKRFHFFSFEDGVWRLDTELSHALFDLKPRPKDLYKRPWLQVTQIAPLV